MPAIIMTFLYAALSIVGGLIGYIQARSKPSLISGGIAGSLLLLAAIGMVQGRSWSSGLAIAVTSLLVIVFLVRLYKTRKWMPAGLMVVAGIGTLLALLV